MTNSYIKKAYIKHLASEQGKQPRDRYKQYVYDLYSLYGDNVTESTFLEGGQYTYEEMLKSLFGLINRSEEVSNYDLMVFCNWAQEFDPDYAAYFYYYLFEQKLNCNSFDVSEHGTLSPVLALKAIAKYHQAKNSKKTLLVALEQTTVPRNIEDYDLMPTMNGVGALAVEHSDIDIKDSLKILDTGFLDESAILNKGLNLIDVIKKATVKFAIAEKDLSVYTSKSSIAHKSLRYFKSIANNPLPSAERHFDNRWGCLPLFECIGKLLNGKDKSRYFLIFIEDAESMELACLLLERF